MADKNFDRFIKNSIKKIVKTINPDKSHFEASSQKATRFLIETVRKFKGLSSEHDARDYLIHKRGLFYMFQYSSLGFADLTLPFYDSFPLVLVLGFTPTGFIGINWHWQHPFHRGRILIKLISHHPKTFFNDMPLMPMNWTRWLADIGGNNKKYAKVSIRQYSWRALKKIRGLKVLRVPNIDMLQAIQYTSANFVGISPDDALKWIQRASFAKNPKNTVVYQKYEKIMKAKRKK